jgi:hypothetical protein
MMDPVAGHLGTASDPGAHTAKEPADRDDVGYAVARQQKHEQLHRLTLERRESR